MKGPSLEEIERRYQEQMGREALKRQKEASKTTCSYCFGKNGQHSQMCKRRRA